MDGANLDYYIYRAGLPLPYDVVEALGLDGSGHDGNERFPYTWSSLTDAERARLRPIVVVEPTPEQRRLARDLMSRGRVMLARQGSATPVAALLVRLGEVRLAEGTLDDLVHDLASSEASQVNNGGLAAQIPFLLRHLGVEATVAAIEEAG